VPSGVVGDLGFVGRVEELSAIAARAADASHGRPSLVWIDGAPGAGKTALLRAAVAALPPGFAVLQAEAAELAAEIPFDVVSQLGEVTEAAPFPVAMELLGIWGTANAGGPVAVVVEDLHWADPESRLALLTAARRLREDPVLMLVTSRGGPEDADGWDRLRADPERCLHVLPGPLSQAEVTELAARRGVTLTSAAAERLVRHAGGHPLHVRTLLAELPAAALAAGDGELPAPRSLASTTLARLAELPAEARRLAAALAVLNQPASLHQLGQVAGVNGAARAADGLLGTGFITRRDGGGPAVLTFAHPLYRTAVYADMPPSLRQELHRRAADATGGTSALAHRVAAADSADDDLAAELELAAQGGVPSGFLGRAASYLLWAAQLSSSRSVGERRLLAAARLLLAARRSSQVEPLRAQIEACAVQPVRSLVLGALAYEAGDLAGAEPWLREAAAWPTQPSADHDGDGDTGSGDGVAADAQARLAVILLGQIRAADAADAAARALASPAMLPATEAWAWFALAFAEGLLHGAPAGLDRIARRLPQHAADVPSADVDLLITRGSLHVYSGHPQAALADLRAAVRLVRHGGSLFPHRAHVYLCQSLLITGDWDEALVHGRVALSLVADEGRTWHGGPAHASLACVLGSRGDWDGAAGHLAAADRIAADIGAAEAVIFSVFARGLIAAARDEPAAVIEALMPLAEKSGMGMAAMSALHWWRPLLVMALISTGALDEAEQHIDTLAAFAGRQPRRDASIVALRARLHARAGRPEEAAAAFARAADLLGPDDPLLERALLQHDYGTFLLARGDRRDGIARLMRARAMLAGVGAVPYLERLDARLAGAGIRSPAPAVGTVMALTEREADVAALVSKGLTNAEVAAELYVSVNTVEYHLRNVFAKLGIRSRRELRARVSHRT
jgi:DNA-binding CsgD family transcriptional regulator/tetratricopeptide (TPR) repeat protein